MVKIIIDAVGWLGAGLLLTAYALVSFKKLRPDTAVYQLLNAIGSCCLIVNTVFYHAFPSAFVNVIWIVIAGFAFYRIRSSREVREAHVD